MPPIGHPLGRVLPALVGLAGLCLTGPVGIAAAEAAPLPPAPTHRELWVPQRSLAAALKTTPKAVLLTRDQFEKLLRDTAAPAAADAHAPPVTAVLRSARYAGSLGERAALLRAEFVIDGFGETWTELPITLDPRWLGAVTVDGTTAVSATDQAAVLVVRGAGRHVVQVDFAAPIIESAGSRTLALRAPGAVEATLVLSSVPETLKLDSTVPFTRDHGTALFALPPGRDEFRISWTARDVAPLETSGLFQDCQFVYSIDAAQVRADLSFNFHGALRNLPASLALPVAVETQVLAVEGAELARWSLAGEQLLVEFRPGDRHETDLRVQLSLPVDDAATALTLPAPLSTGMHRASGSFTILGHPGLRVRRVTTGALATRDDTQAPGGLAQRPEFRGTWAFPVLLEAPSVEIERLTSRFTATMDTQLTLAREAVHLTRHLAFQPRDGTLFSPRVTGLGAGEEIDTVTRADGGDIVWRPVEGGVILITPAGTEPGQSLNVIVTSTLRPSGWNQLADAPTSLAFVSAQLPGVEKISGYVAVDFDESLRVTTPRTDGLEPRDPRQFAGKLPLTGRLAWFRLDAFQLDLAVARRSVEFDAAIALDVLPLLNSLEVEGQLTLAIAHGGLRELTAGFPAAMAPSVRWESPLISEKSMTDDGRWTLKFHQETTGTPHLRFHASLPLTDSTAGSGSERRFAAQVPFPSVADARRSTGTLVVEANSDTELAFAPQALDDLDPRDAPAIEGHAPRHRLVAGYAWRGGQPALAIDGVRHRSGDLAGTVVDSLVLDSVVSADGPQRHQAVLALRSTGAQFLDLTLPKAARVLSVIVDGLAAKPIRGPKGTLRLPLPNNEVRLQVIYETPAAPMTGRDPITLPPLTLDPHLPVLDTVWRLHLPEGFSYSTFDSNLSETDAPAPPPSLARVVMTAPLIARFVTAKFTGRVLLEVERSSARPGADGFGDNLAGTGAVMAPTLPLPAEIELITSSETLNHVVTKLGLVERWKSEVRNIDEARAKLERMTDAAAERGTDLVRLEVHSTDKAEAAELANEIATAYIERRKSLERDRVDLAFNTLTETRKAQELAVERARNQMLEIVQEAGIVDFGGSAPDQVATAPATATPSGAGNAKFQQAREIYRQQMEILNKMVEEQEKARVVNLMPRQPATIHEFASADDGRNGGAVSMATERPAAPAAFPMTPSTPIPEDGAVGEQAAQSKAPMGDGKEHFALGMGQAALGELNEAKAEFNRVLSIDPTNTPARRELERIERLVSDHALASQDHSRADMLRQVDVPNWEGRQGGPGGGGGGGRPATRAGLLPLEFSLPEGGRTVTFAGKFAPAPLSFRAAAWDRQVRLAWVWMLAGGMIFSALQLRGRRPVFIGLLGALTLHFGPFIAARPEWTPIANALLTGWLVALGITLFMAVAQGAARRGSSEAEVAHG